MGLPQVESNRGQLQRGSGWRRGWAEVGTREQWWVETKASAHGVGRAREGHPEMRSSAGVPRDSLLY